MARRLCTSHAAGLGRGGLEESLFVRLGGGVAVVVVVVVVVVVEVAVKRQASNTVFALQSGWL